jgi:formylglycine-generating enzyme required for sulfatase activity
VTIAPTVFEPCLGERVRVDMTLTRVLRGGSWGNPASNARSTNRNGNAPAEPDDSMGFRLVLAGHPGSL